MEKKLRLLLTTSTIALSAAACAPNNSPLTSLPPANSTPVVTPPVNNPVVVNNPVNTGGAVTHSHGGKVHSHRLPAGGLNHTHTIGSGNTAPVVVNRPVAPAPVVNRPNPSVNRNAPVSHSHGGKVHSHRLPATGLSHTHAIGTGPRAPQPQRPVVNRPVQPAPVTRPVAPVRQPVRPAVRPPVRGGVNHTHCGRAHVHPLPPQGTHNHNNVNCPGGTQQVRSNAQPRPQQPRPQAPQNNRLPQQPNNTNYNYYDYANTNRPAAPNNPQPNTGSTNYYDYTNNTNTNTNPVNNNNNSYYDQARPKPSVNYTPSTNTNYDYTPPNTSTNPPASTAPAPVSGDTYVVKRGDTVFQVMRNTGVYWKDIIRLNNLQAPNYQINPGQQLRLR